MFDTERPEFTPDGMWELPDCNRGPIRLVGPPDVDGVFVQCHDFVASLDVGTLSPLRRAPSPDSPHPDMALAPDGRRLYGLYPHVKQEVRSDGLAHVTGHELRLLAWETEEGGLVLELGMGDLVSVPLPTPGRDDAGYLAASHDGDRVFVVWEDMLWALNVPSLTVAGELRLPAPVDGIAQSVDGSELYLLPATSGNLEVRERGMFTVDATTLALVRHAADWPELGIPLIFAAPAPDGR